jgi:hypothetical protein
LSLSGRFSVIVATGPSISTVRFSNCAASALLACVGVAEHATLHLPGLGPRKVGHELEPSGALERGEFLPAVPEQLRCHVVAGDRSGGRLDYCDHALTPARVRNPDDRHVQDGWMRDQVLLDLGWASR